MIYSFTCLLLSLLLLLLYFLAIFFAVDPTVNKEQKVLEECFRLLGNLEDDAAKVMCVS